MSQRDKSSEFLHRRVGLLRPFHIHITRVNMGDKQRGIVWKAVRLPQVCKHNDPRQQTRGIWLIFASMTPSA